MARFEIAEAITGRNEGGYANNPADTGGETYAGIARNHWPKWEGWAYIDGYKSDWQRSNKSLSLAKWVNASAKVNTEPVLDMVSQFYKQNFWDVNKLDQINDQQLANTVYDFGVNSGTGRSAKFLQQSYNTLQLWNRSGVKLVVDGKIGPDTISKVNSCDTRQLHSDFNGLRETFYRSIAKGSQAQFLKSWLSRLKPYST